QSLPNFLPASSHTISKAGDILIASGDIPLHYSAVRLTDKAQNFIPLFGWLHFFFNNRNGLRVIMATQVHDPVDFLDLTDFFRGISPAAKPDGIYPFIRQGFSSRL